MAASPLLLTTIPPVLGVVVAVANRAGASRKKARRATAPEKKGLQQTQSGESTRKVKLRCRAGTREKEPAQDVNAEESSWVDDLAKVLQIGGEEAEIAPGCKQAVVPTSSGGKNQAAKVLTSSADDDAAGVPTGSGSDNEAGGIPPLVDYKLESHGNVWIQDPRLVADDSAEDHGWLRCQCNGFCRPRCPGRSRLPSYQGRKKGGCPNPVAPGSLQSRCVACERSVPGCRRPCGAWRIGVCIERKGWSQVSVKKRLSYA